MSETSYLIESDIARKRDRITGLLDEFQIAEPARSRLLETLMPHSEIEMRAICERTRDEKVWHHPAGVIAIRLTSYALGQPDPLPTFQAVAIAYAGNPPVTDEQIAAVVHAARKFIQPLRYVVLSVPNVLTGERYVICDTAKGNTIIAVFYNVTHREGDHLVIDQAIGWANAQMLAQILNVTEEASRGK